MTTNETFAQEYINLWNTIDDNQREEAVKTLYAADAVFYATQPDGKGMQAAGHEAIVGNIKTVNERDIQGKGVSNQLVSSAANHDVVKISWQMVTPDGTSVMNGASVLMCDEAGKIVKDYIFIG